MNLLSKLRQVGKAPPDWASHLNSREYAAFLTDVQLAVGQLDPQAIFCEEEAMYRMANGRTIGLYNLCRIWKNTAKSKRLDEIHNFVFALEETSYESVPWEVAQHALRTRLYPFDPEVASLPSVVKNHFNSFLEVIVLDSPKSVRTVSEQEVEAWGKPIGELGSLALQNTIANESVHVSRGLLSGMPITAVGGDSIFSASFALDLGRFVVKDDAPLGVLLIIPARTGFFFSPAVKETLLPLLKALIELAEDAFLNDPGSVCVDVFWWRNGIFAPVPFGPKGLDVEKLGPMLRELGKNP